MGKMLATISINVSKIDKSRLVEGKNGAKYLNLVLFEQDPPKYDKDITVAQSISKEERQAKVQAPIIGNGNQWGKRQPSRPSAPVNNNPQPADDDSVPF